MPETVTYNFEDMVKLKKLVDMNMNLQAQLEAMQDSFERQQESESKVSNIKQRIFLKKKPVKEFTGTQILKGEDFVF